MKIIKNEKGAITILLLVSVLLMISFLISSYIIISNKVRAQKEIIAQTKSIYEGESMEDAYNDYFGKSIVRIKTSEQLLAIEEEQGKIIYILENDIEFNAYDEETLRDIEKGRYYWVPIGEKKNVLFEGNDHTITVKYRDNQDNTEYSVIYSKDNNYSEPEYTIKINPRLLSEDGQILEDAIISNTKDGSELGIGETEIKLKRGDSISVQAISSRYKNSGIETIYIENPNKIRDYNLVLGKYNFTINPSPEYANVTINGERRTTIAVENGEQILWEVSAEGYVTQSGTYVMEEDTTIDVSLDIATHTFTIIPTPSNATVMINGVVRRSITVDYGTTVSYSVSYSGYHSQEGSETVTGNSTITASLREIVYVPFVSEKDYITVCSNTSYPGLFWGGEESVSHSSTITSPYERYTDMGMFRTDVGLIGTIPLDATISKVTLYYSYKQSRSNTTLYKNKILTTVYTGTEGNLTEKMSQQTSDLANNSYVTKSYVLTNINRQELVNGITIHFTNYFKGTLSIESYIKDVYCIIEGTYPT